MREASASAWPRMTSALRFASETEIFLRLKHAGQEREWEDDADQQNVGESPWKLP